MIIRGPLPDPPLRAEAYHYSLGQMVCLVYLISVSRLVGEVEIPEECLQEGHDPLQEVQTAAVGGGFKVRGMSRPAVNMQKYHPHTTM